MDVPDGHTSQSTAIILGFIHKSILENIPLMCQKNVFALPLHFKLGVTTQFAWGKSMEIKVGSENGQWCALTMATQALEEPSKYTKLCFTRL